MRETAVSHYDAAIRHSASVLVVEDEELVRQPMVDELVAAGYHVRETGSGQAAIDILQSDKSIRIVLTDLRMPGVVDGAALAAWIARERPDVWTVVVSGFYSARRQDIPAHLVLEKPVAPSVVINAVDVILAANKLAVPLQ